MPKVTIKLGEQEKVVQTDDFTERQRLLFSEGQQSQSEAARHQYIAAVLTERRDIMIKNLLDEIENPQEEPESDDKEET